MIAIAALAVALVALSGVGVAMLRLRIWRISHERLALSQLEAKRDSPPFRGSSNTPSIGSGARRGSPRRSATSRCRTTSMRC